MTDMNPTLLNHVNFTDKRLKGCLGEFMEHCEMSGLKPSEMVAAMLSMLLANAAELSAIVAPREPFLSAAEAAIDAAIRIREEKRAA